MSENFTWKDVEPTLSLAKSRAVVGEHLVELATVDGMKDNQIVRALFKEEVIQELGINHLAPIVHKLREKR